MELEIVSAPSTTTCRFTPLVVKVIGFVDTMRVDAGATLKLPAWNKVMGPVSVLLPLTLSTLTSLERALGIVMPPCGWRLPPNQKVTGPLPRAPPVWRFRGPP